MSRKPPRPPEQARAIARALRQRYISPEVEAAAKRGLAKSGISMARMVAAMTGRVAAGTAPPRRQSDARPTAAASAAGTARAGSSAASPLLDLIREREGIVIEPPGAEAPFTAEEQARARAVLEAFKRRARRN